MSTLIAISILTVTSLVVMLIDAYLGRSRKGEIISGILTTLGLVAAGISLFLPIPPIELLANSFVVADGPAIFFGAFFMLTLLLTLMMSNAFVAFSETAMSTLAALMLLVGAGLILLASSVDLLALFIGIEMVSIPSFIMAGFLFHKDARSAESALKFFLTGTFSAGLLIYGISLLYALTGTTNLPLIVDQIPNLVQPYHGILATALFLMVAGIGFKMALVPFHMWVPDVFHGAPTPITAFLSIAPKVAGIVVAYRIFATYMPHSVVEFSNTLWLLAVLTITTANILALQQTNVKRLLAYSSISHVGYLFLGVIAAGDAAWVGIAFYSVAYLMMNIGAFTVAMVIMDSQGSEDLTAFSGLSQRAPWLAGVLVLFLVSLAGLPPTAGFIAKFLLLSAALEQGWTWLVVIAAVNAVLAVGYYFRLAYYMYFKSPLENPEPVRMTVLPGVLLGLGSIGVLVLGLFPGPFLTLTQSILMTTPK